MDMPSRAESPSADRLGSEAESPIRLPGRAWLAILKRVWNGNSAHNLGLLSAGVAFYAFLSFVPLLGALVMSYGLVADLSTVTQHMQIIIDLVPADAARLINEQLLKLVETAADTKGTALIIALAISIYGATRASGALITALNVIYEEQDRRGIVRSTLVSAVLIVAAVMIGILGMFAATVLGYAGDLLGNIGPAAETAVSALTWAVAGILCCWAIGAMYRFAPDRADARWEWLSVGAVFGTLLWLGATVLFGVYAANFGDYDTTYGSLGAVVVLLMWLYVSAYAVLIGGLINAETERQTARDSTTGSPRPIGMRGAVVADTSAALEA